MTINDLIFSNERCIRITRHILFWFCWYLYLVTTQLRNISPEDIGMNNFIIYQLGVSANRLLLQIIFCYTTIYFLIPRFVQKKKYKLLITAFTLFLIGMYWITYLAYTYTSPFFRGLAGLPPLTPFLTKYYILYSHIHFTGSLVACSIILAIKFYKNWYKKQRENELLINENTQAELQLLKAQVHPHFLFNTFNNIYALTLDDSPKAGITIKKLSGMVHYMINEGAESLVPVNKEVKMLLDYIGLEKIRYGERLNMTIEIKQAHNDNRLIAPLLMLPFVENCFKHGASKTMNKAVIQLFIETTNDWLDLKISNTRPALSEKPDDRKKIGLQNVQKRLELLYPGKHHLDIQSTEVSFTVHMKVKLEISYRTIVPSEPTSTHREKISYAH
jgi:sensor histidine kinase YesM